MAAHPSRRGEGWAVMIALIKKLDWPLVIILAFGLGLAPFTPPHLYEKLVLLSQGNLVKPVDWFDLVMHGSPWLLLVAKLVVSRKSTTK
jgi:hypothetical protein